MATRVHNFSCIARSGSLSERKGVCFAPLVPISVYLSLCLSICLLSLSLSPCHWACLIFQVSLTGGVTWHPLLSMFSFDCMPTERERPCATDLMMPTAHTRHTRWIRGYIHRTTGRRQVDKDREDVYRTKSCMGFKSCISKRRKSSVERVTFFRMAWTLESWTFPAAVAASWDFVLI